MTANDISQRALDRVAAVAAERGLLIECHHADANAAGAFEPGAFDLVSAHYASIPRTPDGRGVGNPARCRRPRRHAARRGSRPRADAPPNRHACGQPTFDTDAYVRVDDFIAALVDSPNWNIEVHEKRRRPPGAASAGHHVDDIVLRARRLND